MIDNPEFDPKTSTSSRRRQVEMSKESIAADKFIQEKFLAHRLEWDEKTSKKIDMWTRFIEC
jgi:hypothetical protein